MKILLIPLDFHKHKDEPLLFGDLLRAFSVGNEAVIYTTLDEAIGFRPDLVFYQGSLSIEECAWVKRETKCKFTMWTGDVRYAPMQSLVEMKDVVDQYYLPFSGELLKTYEYLLGKPCAYIWEPLHNWKVIKPKELTTGNITFIGNLYETVPGGAERIELKRFLSGKVDNLFFENGIPNNTLPGLYADSFAVIAENNWSNIEGYFTPRNLLAMSNSCCLARYFPGIHYFKNWGHCVYYKNKYELLDIINYLKLNPEKRNDIAKRGHELATNLFTYDNWAKQYIYLLQ